MSNISALPPTSLALRDYVHRTGPTGALTDTAVRQFIRHMANVTSPRHDSSISEIWAPRKTERFSMAIQPDDGVDSASSGKPYPHHDASGQKQHLYRKARLRPWRDPTDHSRITVARAALPFPTAFPPRHSCDAVRDEELPECTATPAGIIAHPTISRLTLPT